MKGCSHVGSAANSCGSSRCKYVPAACYCSSAGGQQAGSGELEAEQKDIIYCSTSILKPLTVSKLSLSKFHPHDSNFGSMGIVIGWSLCKMRKNLTGEGEENPDLYLKNWTWNSESGMSMLGCQGQWYGLIQQAFGSSTGGLTRNSHLCSGESLVFQA